MDPPYSISIDTRRGLLQFRFVGHMTKQDLPNVGSDFEAAIAKLELAGIKAGQILTLFDLSEQAILQQDVTAEMQLQIGKNSHVSKKVAVLMSDSALHKMQIARVTRDARQNFFSDKDEALRWLMEEA